MLNVSNYTLIGDIENKYLSHINGHKYLRRLELNCPMPKEYKSIVYLHNICVYDSNNFLKPKFWSLKRVFKLTIITKNWICSNCKTITKLKLDIQENDFKCMKCGKRQLLPVKRKE